MIHTCQGCAKKFETKVSRKSYCDDCVANGITYNCGVCGEDVVIKTQSHRVYVKQPNYRWWCQRCASTSKEAKTKRSESIKETYASMPEDHPTRLKASERMKKIHADAGVQEKRLKTLRSDEHRELKRQHAIQQFSDPANREKARQTSLKQWEDLEFREQQAEINKERWAEGSPSRVKASETRIAMWKDPEYRAMMTKVNRDNVTRPEVRAKISESVKQIMLDDEHRKRLSKATSSYFSENEELTEVEYKNVQQTLDSYTGGFIGELSDMGSHEAVKYLRLNSREKDMWETIIAEVIARDGKCYRRDLAELSGYKQLSLNKICRELNLEGLTSAFGVLQDDVGRFIHSIYTGILIEESRPDFLLNAKGNKMELDFYIPEYNLAIEVNGTYWHSAQAGKDDDYHFIKSKLCRENGIRLIHIWEHEWNNERQRPILESIIRSALGLSKRVYARKLKIEFRPSRTMREFYDTNNIQGFRGGKFSICLVDPETNQVVMAYNIGKGNHMSRKYEYEVVRGASLLNHTVVGGSSKLLSALFNSEEHDINELVYYIDYNYFDGASLKKDPRWEFIIDRPSFKNYWVKTGEVKNRDPGRNKEITEKYKTGEVLKLCNAGTATYVYRKGN